MGNGVSTIRVSGWVEHALISVEVRFIPPANAGGTDLITTWPQLLRQKLAMGIRMEEQPTERDSYKRS
jgi:hypothetical protein